MYFKKVNINPLNKKTGDCVIRAIANAQDKSWYEVFDQLIMLARKNASVPNNKDIYEKYLSKYETIPVMYVNELGNKKRLRPVDFAKHGLNGTYIVSLAGHLTCVRNGVCEDIWDCSCKSAYKIWKIK